MKFYLNAYSTDWDLYIHHSKVLQMLYGKNVLCLQLYGDTFAPSEVIELTVDELKLLRDNMEHDYGMDEMAYPLIELEDVNSERMIFELRMESTI